MALSRTPIPSPQCSQWGWLSGGEVQSLHKKMELVDMQLEVFELHVQHAIQKPIQVCMFGVSNCMSGCDLHVQHAAFRTIWRQWTCNLMSHELLSFCGTFVKTQRHSKRVFPTPPSPNLFFSLLVAGGCSAGPEGTRRAAGP